jgi:thymidylate synthase (FAD)
LPILDERIVEWVATAIDTQNEDAFELYNLMLDQGIAKELARTVLPVGMYTRMKWTVNLRSLFNFLSLRNHEHAQQEIADYAVVVEELASRRVPLAFEYFVAHGRTAP